MTKKKARPATRKKATDQETAIAAAAEGRLGEQGLKLGPLQELLDQVKLQIQADQSPAAAMFTAALNIQREINRLGGVAESECEDPAGAADELQRCRDYLEPLALGPPELPVSELVRLAVCKLAS